MPPGSLGNIVRYPKLKERVGMNIASLAYLACPAMMLFCMKGMFGGKKKDAKGQGQMNAQNVQAPIPQTTDDMQALQLRIADLMTENYSLKQQVQDSDSSDPNVSSSSNVVPFVDEHREKKVMS